MVAVEAPAAPPSIAESDSATESAPSSRARPTRRPDAPPLPAAVPAVTVPLTELPGTQAKSADVLVPSLLNRPVTGPSPALESLAPAAANNSTAQGTSRPAGRFERLGRRTLSDPARSQPLVQLAERLRRDAEQTDSKTLMLVGVGKESTTHETLLYAATLLAETGPGRVLLIDADLARRPLSEALEYGQEPGLAELLRGDALSDDRYRPTAVAKLSFLPAGLLQDVDLATAGPRLELLWQQLSVGFSYVLLDAGRTSDPAATVLARLADATYFVVQLGTVETSEAQAALRDFHAAGARVLGCIAT